ncbi:MAG: hypothetical protein ACXVP4_06935 [Bacteroidia bacterium]
MDCHIRKIFLFFFLIITGVLFSQTDTSITRGTIKIAKANNGEVYIKATADFKTYDVAKLKLNFVPGTKFQPFPVVDGYAYPFNYTQYFNDCFKTIGADLKGKTLDTLIVEVIILSNGKSYFKEMAGDDFTENVKPEAYDLKELHLNGLKFLRKIKRWFPGYIILPKKDKYKGEVVIKPDKKNVDVTGTITIVFSTTPFDD